MILTKERFGYILGVFFINSPCLAAWSSGIVFACHQREIQSVIVRSNPARV
jgi:hypothetical protein